MLKYLNWCCAGALSAWGNYKTYAEKQTAGTKPVLIKDISYWREKLFTTFSIYFVPTSFIALVPGVWMSIYVRLYYVACFDMLAAAAITLVIFNSVINLNLKKVLVAGILYILALLLIVSLGLFGPGILYLLAITVFLTLVLPVKWAYWSVVLHFTTCALFGLSIYFKLLSSLVLEKFTLGIWVAFSSNLIFLSLVCVILIDKIITGLESTIIQERELQITLQKETSEKATLHDQLFESERYYKSLFILNPSPMWVIDSVSFRFLEVNEAAIENYGYSRAEFLLMTIRGVRFEKDNEVLLNTVNNILSNDEPYHFITKHCGKNQIPFPVDMRYIAIIFKGNEALLGTARDITEQVNYTTAIENQNAKLREIAFIQSHVVRAPLARMMGLMDIFSSAADDETKTETIRYLKHSADEIDGIIRDIINKVQVVDEVPIALNKK